MEFSTSDMNAAERFRNCHGYRKHVYSIYHWPSWCLGTGLREPQLCKLLQELSGNMPWLDRMSQQAEIEETDITPSA